MPPIRQPHEASPFYGRTADARLDYTVDHATVSLEEIDELSADGGMPPLFRHHDQFTSANVHSSHSESIAVTGIDPTDAGLTVRFTLSRDPKAERGPDSLAWHWLAGSIEQRLDAGGVRVALPPGEHLENEGYVLPADLARPWSWSGATRASEGTLWRSGTGKKIEEAKIPLGPYAGRRVVLVEWTERVGVQRAFGAREDHRLVRARLVEREGLSASVLTLVDAAGKETDDVRVYRTRR